MFKIRTAVFVATGALAALGVAGTALAADGGFPASAPPSATADSAVRDAGTVSAEAAGEIAIRVVGGGFAESVEPETEHGRPVWNVDVFAAGVEHDVDVDRATGEVLRHRTGDGADLPVSPPASANPTPPSTNPTPRSTPRASASDDHGRRTGAGDDRGGNRTRSAEPGDDNGGTRTRHAEAGDDNGGTRTRGAEAGDDNGGRGHGGDDKGRDDKGRDDKGRDDRGGDDKGGDDRGGDDKGRDDRGGDDHGRGGHGSDD
ncbi:hypothetical protein Acy02nite_70120 [Actinoplanes cyaneus]|uniref:PepSY domain-containing protein n=1 Tax=Actinoplanes cyaneus TaxID=52696 RepID=A0A919IQI3_9ACTN|nr:PepSY domain-containing protein [Actinoplanes cyaneus]MCW2140878.1 putative membrane protein YkoI [Actinoplanes cyaneus]GID69131.1 hypothetical protein Acy02nite_70120 [Actinoplanes cyaneus]